MKLFYIPILWLFFVTVTFPQVVEKGFGYSHVAFFRNAGADENHDGFGDGSAEVLFGMRFGGEGKAEIEYAFSHPEGTQGKAVKAMAADINGDGMDDAIAIYSEPGPSRSALVFYDGYSGDGYFSRENYAEYGDFVNLFACDFEGDGISDAGVICSRGDRESGTGKKYYSLVFNGKGKLLSAEPIHGAESITVLGIYDTDNDNREELAVYIRSKDEYSLRFVSISTGEVIYEKVCDSFEFSHPPILMSYNSDKGEKVYTVTHRRDGEKVYSVIENITNRENDGSENLLTPEIDNAKVYITDACLIESGSGKKALLAVSGNGSYGNSKGSLILADLLTGEYFPLPGAATDGEYLKVITGQFDADPEEEFAALEAAYADLDGDGNADGADIKIYDDDGTELWDYATAISGGKAKAADGVITLEKGDINADGSDELVILARWGRDVNADGIKDNGYLYIFDIFSGKTLLEYSAFDHTSGGYGGYRLLLLNNDITDRELVLSLNRASIPSAISEKITAKDFSGALDELYTLFENRSVPSEFLPSGETFFYSTTGDLLVKRLKNVSTASGVTDECSGCNIGNPANIHLRMKGLLGTLISRLYDPDNKAPMDKNLFKLALKSLLSNMRYSSRPENFSVGNNHGLLFELDAYIQTAIFLDCFTDRDNGSLFSWSEITEERIDQQLAHVLEDGSHDERSFSYTYLIAEKWNQIAELLAAENSFPENSEYYKEKIIENIARMYEYLLYSVKPVTLKIEDDGYSSRADVPLFGDSGSRIVNKWFGKLPLHGETNSLLLYPEQKGYTKFWKNRELIENLRFAAYGTLEDKGEPPAEISKAFKASGTFISRSNWVTPEDGKYDPDARYALFTAGEIVPSGGPYKGRTTDSRHSHSDLLSLELAAYDKNLVTDPAGYISSDANVKNFDTGVIAPLYGYEFTGDLFSQVRKYFKSTAAHNTVYIDNTAQVKFVNQWNWGGLDNLREIPLASAAGEEMDAFSAGYIKNDGNLYYTHNRVVIYVKPLIGGKIVGDYWLVTDNIEFKDNNLHTADQLWHISDEQTKQDIEPEGIFTGDNFKIVPVRNEKVTTDMPDGYTMPGSELLRTKIVRYRQSGYRSISFSTVIIPYPEDKTIEIVSLEPLPGNKDGYAFSFTTSESGKQVNDTLVFNRASGNIGFLRYSDGVYLKNIDYAFTGTGQTEEKDYSYFLHQNYPNPFNATTQISFTMPDIDFCTLKLYDVRGSLVKVLYNGLSAKGTHKVTWNGTNGTGEKVASGVYLCRFVSSGFAQTRKLVLLK